jgi:hypothetical protein
MFFVCYIWWKVGSQLNSIRFGRGWVALEDGRRRGAARSERRDKEEEERRREKDRGREMQVCNPNGSPLSSSALIRTSPGHRENEVAQDKNRSRACFAKLDRLPFLFNRRRRGGWSCGRALRVSQGGCGFGRTRVTAAIRPCPENGALCGSPVCQDKGAEGQGTKKYSGKRKRMMLLT